VEDVIATREDIGDDETKDLESRKERVRFLGRLLGENEQWVNAVYGLKDFKVMKLGRVLQSLFYFLKYDREDVCEVKTNKFWWKKAKENLNEDFLKALMAYNPTGPKPEQFKRYWLLNFIEKNIEGIQQEDVDAYSVTIGKLFRWLTMAIQVRKDDIIKRMIQKRKLREERERIIQLAQEREERREKELEAAQIAFEEEHKEQIEAAIKAEEEEENKEEDEYGEEEDDDDENKEEKPVEKPERPVFDQEKWLEQWEEEN